MLVLLATFLLSMMTIAATCSLRLLTLANATCLLCIPLLGGPAMIGTGTGVFTGAIFFPVALFGLSLICIIHGANAAHLAGRFALFAMVIVFGSIFILEEADLLGEFFDSGIRRVVTAACIWWKARFSTDASLLENSPAPTY